MSYDIALTVVNVILGLLLTGIGIEMVNNPPTTDAKKWTYRTLFGIFGIGVIIITFIQSVRSASDQEQNRTATQKSTEQSHQDQLASQTKMAYMQGTLDSITKFESQYIAHPPSNGSKFDVAAAQAIIKMAQSTPQVVDRPVTNVDRPLTNNELRARVIDVTDRLLRIDKDFYERREQYGFQGRRGKNPPQTVDELKSQYFSLAENQQLFVQANYLTDEISIRLGKPLPAEKIYGVQLPDQNYALRINMLRKLASQLPLE